MRLFPTALVAIACALAPVAAAASATTAHGSLTAAEFQQLSAAEQALDSPTLNAHPERAMPICERTKLLSPLMSAWKQTCLDVTTYAVDGARAQRMDASCASRSSAERSMDCMLPSYTAFSMAAGAFYAADEHLTRLAAARGLGTSCAAALGDSAKILAAEGRLADDLRQLVDALRTHDLTAVKAALKHALADQFGALNGSSTSVSVCPHQ